MKRSFGSKREWGYDTRSNVYYNCYWYCCAVTPGYTTAVTGNASRTVTPVILLLLVLLHSHTKLCCYYWYRCAATPGVLLLLVGVLLLLLVLLRGHAPGALCYHCWYGYKVTQVCANTGIAARPYRLYCCCYRYCFTVTPGALYYC